MQLTITNPEIVHSLVDMPIGLLPILRVVNSRNTLIVKASREAAQIARLRGEFRFYLVPVDTGSAATCGLVTAFLDDNDEPLVIRTPLIDEKIARDLVWLLSSGSFYVHFFDEHNRELLGFRAENPDAHRFRELSNGIRFALPTLDQGRQMLDELQSWFSARSPSDDDAAFTVHLRERLFPDSLEENVDNPGDLNEHDIAIALRRPFRGTQVFLNPIRADNGLEFVDVLVATTKTLLLIQAKDSPSTESALNRKIVRKMATAEKHVRKATDQLKGSINHLGSGESIEIITDGKLHSVSRSTRDIFGLVIVKELFDAERPTYSRLVLSVFNDTGIPCILLDHTEFHELTFFQTTEESFVRALEEIFSVAYADGVLPRSRFGLRTGRTVVYDPTETGNAPCSAIQERGQTVTARNRIITTPGMRPREDLGADWLRVVVDRSVVEAHDVSGTAATLSRVLADRDAVKRYRGRVDLAFAGYSNDSRELRDIPEVRHFCSKLDDAFPYWFYFLSTEGVTLGLIACCLCSVTQLRSEVVSFGPDLIDFMERHHAALNWLFDNYSLDERLNVEISSNVTEYFSKSEPIQ